MFADDQEYAPKKTLRQCFSLFLLNLLGLKTLDAYDANVGGVRPVEEHELMHHFLEESRE